MAVISDAEKQQAKEVFKQLISLADEFKPELEELASKYGDLLGSMIKRLSFEQAVLQIYCTLISVNSHGTDSEKMQRAFEGARMLKQGVKE